MGSAIRLAVLGLALAVVLACGGDAGDPRSSDAVRETLVERLIVEDPQVLLDRGKLFKKQPIFTWKLDSAAAIAPWQTRGLASARLGRGQWVLKAAGGDPRLVRPVKIDASELHLLEVTLSGLRKGKATIFWAKSGEEFSEEKSLTVAPPKGRRQRPFTLTFDLAGHRLWGGAVDRLRLDPTDSAEDTVALRSIRGLRRVADPERLTATLGRSWKIDLAADTRNALLTVPGVPLEHELDVGPGQRLQLSYGLEENVQQAVEFYVEATVDDDTPTVLLQETLTPAAGDAGSWREATLDLSAYAGRRLRLKLETRSPELLDLARGFAAWANPEVLGPATEDELPNIILISLDTLRSDRLSAYGHHRETSPNLDRWAANSAVLFENVVVQAPWTLPSHASMFTGLEALRHDVNHYQEAPASLELLAETLRNAGYATAAITGGGYLRPRFGFAQGFDTFRYWPQILAERELADGSERLMRWLDAHHARRFFLFFHTYEIHFPHRRRQPYFDRFYGQGSGSAGTAASGEGPAGDTSQPAVDALQCGRAEGDIRGKLGMRARTQTPENPLWQHDYFTVETPAGDEVEHLNPAEKELIRTCYDSAIAYVDAQLGQLFERLETLGLDGRTLIILTSDHGEALGERDRAGHNYHEDYNIMVPLVIEFPDGLGAGQRIGQQVRSIDVVPTLLDALGLPTPQPVDGVSLLPLIRGEASAVPDEAWTYASSANYGLGLRYRNQLKYIFNNTAWSRFLGQEALYNLRRDPDEEDDLAAQHSSTAELRAKAIQAIEAQHEGLRMRIRNSGGGTLSGQLKYAWARHNKVKAADTSCRCLKLSANRAVTFELEPDQETTLYFESIAGHRMGLAGRLELPGRGPAPFDETFDPNKIVDPVVFEHTADGWRRSSDDASGEASVAFRIWRQSQRAGQPVSEPVDARLQQQLEALGYVN